MHMLEQLSLSGRLDLQSTSRGCKQQLSLNGLERLLHRHGPEQLKLKLKLNHNGSRHQALSSL